MFLPEYLNWHYNISLKKVLLSYKNCLIFITYYFSIPQLLKTLFYPWKRQLDSGEYGFNLSKVISAFAFNIISRSIGAMVRLSTIFSGLVIILITTISGLFLILLFIMTPFLWLPLFVYSKAKSVSKADKIIASSQNLRQLLLSTLDTEEAYFISERLGLNPKSLSDFFRNIYDQGDMEGFKNKLSAYTKDKSLTVGSLYVVLAQTYLPFGKVINQYNVKPEDLESVSFWFHNFYQKPPQTSLTDLQSLKKISGIGRNWAYGFTPSLDKYAVSLDKSYILFPTVVGRDKDIAEAERVLSKTSQNSIVLVGEPGVGRHTIIYGLLKLINEGMSLSSLSYKRLVSLDLKLLSAGYANDLEVKKEIGAIFTEAKSAGNIIIIIDSFDTYIGDGVGRINLSDVFAENLGDGRLQIIGITDPSSYHNFLLPNTTLTKLFEKIEIEPPSPDVVLEELEASIVPIFESKYHIVITYYALKEIIKDSTLYESSNPFPEKAIDLLDEALVYIAAEKKETVLTATHIQEFLSQKKKIPIGSIGGLEKEKLLNLESLLHEQIINQEKAVSSISQALRRARTQVSSQDKPVGSFLFLGPTGVGKTETAKALARIYFGSEDKMLRFDMSQYQKDEGLQRLIGSQTGQTGELTERITDNPFSLLLLDEIEKADDKIFNLLLTLLDEGYIEDARARKIDARNLIIIATSNAGAEYIRQQILKGINNKNLKDSLIDYIQKKHIFSPEFLNRFDDVIVFTPLTEGNLKEVTKLLLQKLNRQLAKQEVSINITNDLINKLTTLGFDPVFGARAIKRTIAEKIEDKVARMLIEGEVKKGDQITINL